ncbi:MAG: HEAT repeat domain-containing protein [Planctomycetes bacterium]|nr:HEAT repeat domain-containing protein [Planctomycetota bacterium]
MRRRFPSSFAVLALVVAALAACGDGAGPGDALPDPEADPLTRSLIDPGVSSDVRIERILAIAEDRSPGAVHALLRALRDRSQAAFLLAPDEDQDLGYRAVEFKKTGDDAYPMERVAAVVALEKTGSYVALPDLLLALDDRNEVVQNHVARALVRLGSKAGIPVLLANLEKRILQNETANQILEDISGEDMGFNPDAGWALKNVAIQKWEAWWEGVRAAGTKLPIEGRPYQQGMDLVADRRIAFIVDMLGQMQFLYHEQARATLARMGAPALPLLRAGVESARRSGNATTRAGIAHVLAHIDHANSRELLVDLLKDQHPTVRSRATESLGQLGGAAAIQALSGALDDVDPAVRLAAVSSLGRVGGDDAIVSIRGFDGSADAALASAKILALFEATGGKEQVDAVLAMLLAVDIPARNAAHTVLARLTGDDAGYDAMATEKDRDSAVRRYRALLEG